ncbi:hypothetical protein LWI28_015786 [Acer negundo]|uniref:Proteasome maturation protein n=1 Tax=Acer negundo TaxID=4023 RepID=A0AAD5NWX0_ACENE|nr:hypothetical protein LWI28_015786 [Acer negundo]
MQNGALDVILQQWQRIISLLHNWFDGCGDTAEDADRLFPKCLHSTLSLSAKAIAHEIGGLQNDALRFGLQGVKSDIVGSHPLETSYQSARKTQEEMKKRILADTYGTAFPLKMDLDRQILSRFHRPAGAIPSSMLGLEALTGSLDDFGFEDYLNDPRESEPFRPADMHHGMEVRLGLSKGPVCPSFL